MQIKQVSKSDIENCIKVVNALKVGKFEVSGPDLVALSDAIKWLANTAMLISNTYQAELAAPKPVAAAPAILKPSQVQKTTEMGKSKKLKPASKK